MPQSAGPTGPSDLRPRVISAIFLMVVTVLMTWLGGFVFGAAMAALTAVLYFEWTRMTLLPTQAFSVLWCAGGVFIAGIALTMGRVDFALWFAAGAAIALAAGIRLGLFPSASFTRSKWAITGLVYSLAAGASMVVIRGTGVVSTAWEDLGADRGLVLVAFLFLTVWATDICAYFVGRSVGGPKLMPSISPKKTISGALGGIVGAVMIGAMFAWATGVFGFVAALALAIVLSIVSQIGDLFESWIKRRYAVKDSSNLIPGHGGFMDRVDGLVFAAVPLAIYVAATT